MNAADSACSMCSDGRDHFVAIDNKIMKRQGDSTLGPCMQPAVACKPTKGTGRPTTERDGGNKSMVQLTKDSAPATQQETSNKSPVQQVATSAPAAQSEMNSKSPVKQTEIMRLPFKFPCIV